MILEEIQRYQVREGIQDLVQPFSFGGLVEDVMKTTGTVAAAGIDILEGIVEGLTKGEEVRQEIESSRMPERTISLPELNIAIGTNGGKTKIPDIVIYILLGFLVYRATLGKK